MPTFIFQLGNTPNLSLAELEAVFPKATCTQLLSHFVAAELEEAERSEFEKLGGIVKVLEVLTTIDDVSDASVTEVLLTHLAVGTEKVHFGLSEVGRDHLPKLSGLELKGKLQTLGKKARYVEGPRSGLTAAVLSHHKNIQEIMLLQAEHLYLCRTVYIQDIDEWTVRDREKPYADRKKGMLPPKVARMMVNLALRTRSREEAVIYDPFCGSGTVLIEAAMTGITNLVGSDNDPDAILGTGQNLQWLAETYDLSLNPELFIHDATQQAHITKPITHLVTEPFLGKPLPKSHELKNIYTGLERLYLGAFKQWRHILADNATVCIVFPSTTVEAQSHTYSLNGLIDKLSKIGYTTISEPVSYHRPQAVVQRNIYLFKFTR